MMIIQKYHLPEKIKKGLRLSAMSFSDNISLIEAILFSYGEPVPVKLLSEASGIGKESLHKIIKLLNDRYNETGSSLQVLKLDKSYQLATRKEFAPYIKKALEGGKNSSLSTASLETLAVIAYNQPVTRAFVETVRGTDSSSVIAKLVEKELIEEAERLDIPGRPIAYKTTENFLRCFGISSVEELPPLEEKSEPDLFTESRRKDD